MKKTYKIIIYVAIAVLIIGLLGILPFIINWIYSQKAPSDFFVTLFDTSDFLVYYASALSFLGTLILGVLTLVQNKRAQEKTNEINQLQLELQKKSMVLAEERYEKEEDSSIIPKFAISVSSYSGHYLNPRIKIQNVSGLIVSNLTFISGCVKTADGEVLRNVTNNKFKNKSLTPNGETILDLEMLNLSKRTGDREYIFYENVDFILEFSVEDEKYKKHYFRAVLHIPTTKDFVNDLWKVEKVG
ncbi:MAG: hypothetical protein J6C09_04370 [Clostridia bacterium]|nr:hypothetical protein [Clostridia bacterium]